MTVLSKLCGTFLGCRILPHNCYEIGHTWEPSCVTATNQILVASFKESLKIYSSLYIITTLLRTTNPKKIQYKRTALDILRSTLFLTSNAFFFMNLLCVLRHAFGFFILPNVGFVNGVLASFISILIERKSRRGLLALYLTNLASEVFFRMLFHRNIIRPVRYGETLIFCLSLAGYMSLWKAGKLTSHIESALKFVFAVPGEPGAEMRFFGYPASALPKPVRYILDVVRKVFPKHSLCKHQNSCASNAFEGFLRNFPFAYVVSVVLRLATSLPKLIKKPSTAVSLFFSRAALRMPLFAGLLPLLYSGCLCAMRHLFNRDDTLTHALAGFVSGGAMLCYPSTSVAMYVMWKLIEILYFKLAEKYPLPQWTHFDVILYSLSTGFVLFAACVEPHALRPAYWKFLMDLTGNNFAYVNRPMLNYFGMDSARLLPNFKPVLDPLFTTSNPSLLIPI